MDDKSGNLYVVNVKFDGETVDCPNNKERKIKKEKLIAAAERGANDFFNKYCNNRVYRRTARLIEEIGGAEDIHRILKIRVNEIQEDDDKSAYVICYYDFCEKGRNTKNERKYSYRSFECCTEKDCKMTSIKRANKRYTIRKKIRKEIWLCKHTINKHDPASTYLLNYVLRPLLYSDTEGKITRKFYSSTGILVGMKKHIFFRGKKTRPCEENKKV